jgi:hypothetical protein
MVATDGKPRRFWLDPRFAVGILLIAASVVGVSALLAAQNRSVQVYVARTTLVAGDALSPDDVELVSVRVPDADRYLGRDGLQGDGVVVRSVPKGELVPATAVREKAESTLTSIVVKASGPVAAPVTAGATADVWAAHEANDKNYRPPAVLVSGAVVVSVSHDDALVADRGAVSVELRVPAARVASVLQAIADGQVISVVPSSGGSAATAGAESPDKADEAEDADAPDDDAATPTPTDRAPGHADADDSEARR